MQPDNFAAIFLVSNIIISVAIGAKTNVSNGFLIFGILNMLVACFAYFKKD